MPSEPTSRWRRLVARLFAPRRWSLVGAIFWGVLACWFVVVTLPGYDVRSTIHGSETFIVAGDRVEWIRPGSPPGPYDQLWRVNVTLTVRREPYGYQRRCELTIIQGQDAADKPLGAPPAEVLDRARRAAVPFFLDGTSFMRWFEGYMADGWVWNRRGISLLALLNLARLLFAALAVVFIVRAVRYLRAQRCLERCGRGDCPACGYPCADLATPTCPECGCDTSATCTEAAQLLGAAAVEQPDTPG